MPIYTATFSQDFYGIKLPITDILSLNDLGSILQLTLTHSMKNSN